MNFKRYGVAALLLVSVYTEIHACDFCGASMGVTPFERRNSFGLTWRNRGYSSAATQTEYFSLLPDGHRLAPGATPSPLHEHSMSTLTRWSALTQTADLRVRYFIFPRLEAQCNLPFTRQVMTMGDDRQVHSGFGGAEINAGWHITESGDDCGLQHRLIAGMGLQLPTGRSNTIDGSGERIELAHQPGTACAATAVWIDGAMRSGKFGASVFVRAKFFGVNAWGEQPALTSNASVSAFAKFSFNRFTLLPRIELHGEQQGGVYTRNVLTTESTTTLLAGPAADVIIGSNQFSAGVHARVWEQSAETTGRVYFSFIHFFELKKNKPNA